MLWRSIHAIRILLSFLSDECHPEHSEGSPSKAHVLAKEISRFARDDSYDDPSLHSG